MKQLFIPELGTEIKLAVNWEFTLYVEKRNSSLFNQLGFGFVDKYDYYSMGRKYPNNRVREFVYEYNQSWIDALENWKKELKEAETKRPIMGGMCTTCSPILVEQADEKFYKFKNDNYSINDWLTTTIPKDSILIVDRIYIRKGNEEFSSVTFVTKFNNKRVRFWAKLEDVNKIKFI